jgi:carbon-monoxide dehydrogenase large subunit
MLVADALGVALDRIAVVHGDTDRIPVGGGTYGSRSLQVGGPAVTGAAQALVERARSVAAELLEADPADMVLDVDAGQFHVAGTPTRGVTWDQVAAASGGLSAELRFEGVAPTYPFGTHLAVVEVDVDTGDTRLVRLVALDDCGTVLNPLVADGQRHGGIAQGASEVLYEAFVYDADGNPLTSSFAEYCLPSAADLPSFELVPMETPTPHNELGAKGIGESGTTGSLAAVLSAVGDALSPYGVEHIDPPITPERVWRALSFTAR